jgi:hypothetical protein
MRDPLENKVIFGYQYFVPDDMEDDDPKHPSKTVAAIEEGTERIKESAKVLSLALDAPGLDASDSLFGRGWARARMWEQYAENHAGVCLAFARDALIENLTESLKLQGLAGPYNKAVNYTLRGTGEGLALGEIESGPLPDGWVEAFVEKEKDHFFFLKTTDWQTEHEYRFVVTADDPGYLFADFGDALKAVAIGHGLARWEWPGVVAASREANAEPFRLEWSTGAPRAWWLDKQSDQS